MKIDRIECRAYATARVTPIVNGRHSYDTSTTCVVEVHTDDGVSGVGLGVGLTIPRGERVIAALISSFGDMLVGTDPLCHERAFERIWSPKLMGRRGAETRAASMVDVALWDIKAKYAGLPLHRLLGGVRDSAPCYVAGGYYEDGKGLDDLAAEMTDYLASGVTAVKMKVGRLSMADDIERVRVVRDAIGPDAQLMVDANGAYAAAEAARMARALEPHQIAWFEEPVPVDDYEGLAIVARASTIPVATGENEATRYGFRDLVLAGGVGVLNADAEIMGGVTEFLKVAALAQAHHLPIAPHGRAAIHLPLVCAIPNGYMVEYYRPNVDPLAEALLPHQPTARDGALTPLDAPGNGLVLDEAAAAPYRVL